MQSRFNNWTDYESSVYSKLAKDHPNLIISPSHLRIENKIINNNGTYKFPILVTGSEVSTEVKLDKNDVFCATQIGMFIYQRSSANKDEGAQTLQTYPNQSYFTAGTSWVKTDLETIYNGRIDFKKGTSTIYESIDTRQFRFVSATQQSSGTNYSSVSADNGMIPLIPVINLPGREAVTITANFPLKAGIAWQNDGSNIDNQMVMFFRGFLVKGAVV